MSVPASNLAASVHQRLLNESRARSVDFNLLLARFASERFLYRLAQSPFTDQFILKGAMMLQIWLHETSRPTRDLDLLGFGDLSGDRLRQIFAAICNQAVEPDGVHFAADSVAIRAIRDQDEYGGQRVTIAGSLGEARLHVQVDVGLGDRPTPPAEWIAYPVLLDLPQPYIRAYRAETTIAEKLHAMVMLDMQNSRMKDFYDVWRLAEECSFSGDWLTAAVKNTFARRQTPLPAGLPIALTQTFGGDPAKAQQWRAFLGRSHVRHVEEGLPEVVEALARFLGPVLAAAHQEQIYPLIWNPGGPWETSPE